MIFRAKGWLSKEGFSRTVQREACSGKKAKRPGPTRLRRQIVITVSSIVLFAAFEMAAAHGQQVLSRKGSTARSGVSAGKMSSSSHPLSLEVQRAKKLLEGGQTEQAIPLLRQAIRDNAQDGDAHLLLGIALSTVPKRSEALQELQKAVALEPRSAVAWFSLGNAQARFADLGSAQKAYENAVLLDPDFVQARIALVLVLAQQNQLQAAEENLVKVITQLGEKPSAAYPHYLLGRVLLEENQPDQALRDLRAATRLRPDYEEAYLTTGLAEKSLHDDRAAVDALEKAVRLSPGDAEAEFQLGSALYRLGEPAQAIGPLQERVEMRPDDRQARYELCQSFRKAGRKQDAVTCQQKLRVLIGKENAIMQSTAATRHNNQGVMLEKAGNLKAAVASYRAAVTLNPTQSVFRRNLALALCRQGRWEKGVAELRKVLREDPGDTDAIQALYIALDHVKGKPGSTSSYAASSKPAAH